MAGLKECIEDMQDVIKYLVDITNKQTELLISQGHRMDAMQAQINRMSLLNEATRRLK